MSETEVSRRKLAREVVVSPDNFQVLPCSGTDPGYLVEHSEFIEKHLELKATIAECVEALPDVLREVIEMRFWGGATYEEIAWQQRVHGFDDDGHPVSVTPERSTILRRERRALQMLREMMEVNGCKDLWSTCRSLAR